MADSSSFSSLLALVDSHLSKTKIQESHSEDTGRIHQMQLQGLTPKQHGTQSESGLFPPNQRLPIPSFNIINSNSAVTNILAEQVTNMLKATEIMNQKRAEEKKQQAEESKHTEQINKLKLEEYYNPHSDSMDLMQVLHTSNQKRSEKEVKNDVIKSSGSLESLLAPTFLDCNSAPIENIRTTEPLLPCLMDMPNDILHKKIKMGRCSTFGKVLTARVKPIATPYLGKQIRSNIKRFKFDCKSPCDIIKERRQRERTISSTYKFDIMEFIMADTEDN